MRFAREHAQSALEAMGERAQSTLGSVGERAQSTLEAVADRLAEWAAAIPRDVRRTPRSPAAGALAFWTLIGAGVGAGLMYMFDPDRGHRRRALLRAKVLRLARQTGEAMDGTSRDVMNRARGMVIEMQKRVTGSERGEEPSHTGEAPRREWEADPRGGSG